MRGAAEGAGLGNAFLSHISAVDGIFHVVGAVPASPCRATRLLYCWTARLLDCHQSITM